MTENAFFRIAGVKSPITASLVNSSLFDCDPVLYQILHFYAGILTLHAGDRWNAECTAANRTDLVDKIVAQVISYDPLPIATEDQYNFPLLAGYRVSEQYEYTTVTWYSIISEVQVIYVMPPLTSDQQKRLEPLSTHIVRTILDRTLEGVDQNYNSGEEVWKGTQLESIGIKSADYGKFPGLKSSEKSNLWFPGVALTLEVKERRMPVDENFEDFTGFDGYMEESSQSPDVEILQIKEDF